MSYLIQLESPACPHCNRSLQAWTMKVVIVDLTVGVRCPACHEFVKLTLKGGWLDEALRNAEARADAQAQMAKDHKDQGSPTTTKEE